MLSSFKSAFKNLFTKENPASPILPRESVFKLKRENVICDHWNSPLCKGKPCLHREPHLEIFGCYVRGACLPKSEPQERCFPIEKDKDKEKGEVK